MKNTNHLFPSVLLIIIITIAAFGQSFAEGVKIPLVLKGVGSYKVETPREISFSLSLLDVDAKQKGNYNVAYVLTIKLDYEDFESYKRFTDQNLNKKIDVIFNGKVLASPEIIDSNKRGLLEIAFFKQDRLAVIQKVVTDYLRDKGLKGLKRK